MDKKLKAEIHRMVDEIDDEAMLYLLKEDITMYQTASSDEILTEEQINELNKAIEEDDKGETVTHQKYKNHVDEWKKKLSSQGDF